MFEFAKRKLLGVVVIGMLGISGSSLVYAGDPTKGGATYTTYCAGCHGQTGTSQMPGAPNFAARERLLQTDAQLLANIKAGKNAMPAFQGIVSDGDIMNVIAFIRTLAR
jgi:mono/diheme cytochrome c family protein